jgi:hypothetical protein
MDDAFDCRSSDKAAALVLVSRVLKPLVERHCRSRRK